MTTPTTAEVGHGSKEPTVVEIDGFRGRLKRTAATTSAVPMHRAIRRGRRSMAPPATTIWRSPCPDVVVGVVGTVVSGPRRGDASGPPDRDAIRAALQNSKHQECARERRGGARAPRIPAMPRLARVSTEAASTPLRRHPRARRETQAVPCAGRSALVASRSTFGDTHLSSRRIS